MLASISALLGRSAAATAFGAVQDSGPGPDHANRHAARELHQDYAKRYFQLDVATTKKAGDVVEMPSYLTDALAELNGKPPAELQRFVGLLGMTFGHMGHDQDQISEMLGELLSPVVEAMNLGEEFRPELIAAALVQRSIAADVGEPPPLVELANSLRIEIVFAETNDDGGRAKSTAIEHVEIRSDFGIQLDLDKALFGDFPDDAEGTAPTLRNLLDASVSAMDHELTNLLTGPGGGDEAIEDVLPATTGFGEKAADVIGSAMSRFGTEAKRVLESIGIDATAIAETVRGLAKMVREALENGTNLELDLSVVAATQTTITTAAGEFQSFTLNARAIHIAINHDTGEVAIDTSEATFEKQTLVLGGAVPAVNHLPGIDIDDLLPGLESREDTAIRELVRQHDADQETPDLERQPEIAIRNVRPGVNLSGERITSFTMDFLLRIGESGADED